MGLAPAAASNRPVLRLVGTQIYQAVAGVLLAVLSPGGVKEGHTLARHVTVA